MFIMIFIVYFIFSGILAIVFDILQQTFDSKLVVCPTNFRYILVVTLPKSCMTIYIFSKDNISSYMVQYSTQRPNRLLLQALSQDTTTAQKLLVHIITTLILALCAHVYLMLPI